LPDEPAQLNAVTFAILDRMSTTVWQKDRARYVQDFNTHAACFFEARMFCCARADRDVKNKRGVKADDR